MQKKVNEFAPVELRVDIISLSDKEKQAVFFLPNIELSSRLLEGSFPNVEEVIPKREKRKWF